MNRRRFLKASAAVVAGVAAVALPQQLSQAAGLTRQLRRLPIGSALVFRGYFQESFQNLTLSGFSRSYFVQSVGRLNATEIFGLPQGSLIHESSNGVRELAPSTNVIKPGTAVMLPPGWTISSDPPDWLITTKLRMVAANFRFFYNMHDFSFLKLQTLVDVLPPDFEGNNAEDYARVKEIREALGLPKSAE